MREPRIMRRLRRYLAAVFLMLAALLSWRYFFPQPPQAQLQPEQAAAGATGPLLVVAPHPDDEVLATGGLIQHALRERRPVFVLMVTNGDGFRLAAERWSGHVRVRPEEMVAFGRARQEETLAAVTGLGVPHDHVIFLGYPDEGTPALWADNWDTPYRSPFTGAMASPYVSAGHPYTGRALLQDLLSVIQSVRPSTVAYPHPSDAHPDHWAVHNFVEAALEQLRATDAAWHSVSEQLYLVHRGDWPAPKGLRPLEGLVPPATLLHGMTKWATVPLAAAEVAAKEVAIRRYSTQVNILRRYMLSFARSNELFGYIPPALLGDGTDWVTVEEDPAGDTIVREALPEGDILGVDARRSGAELQVRIRLRSTPASKRASYTLLMRAFRADGTWETLRRLDWRPGAPGAEAAFRSVLFRLPLADLGNPRALMIGAATTADGLRADRAAWRLVRLL